MANPYMDLNYYYFYCCMIVDYYLHLMMFHYNYFDIELARFRKRSIELENFLIFKIIVSYYQLLVEY